MPKTIYIVPAFSEQAGQCRIYSTPGQPQDPAALYRARPEVWSDFGLMNSQGKLVCAQEAFEQIKECEPLMAGTVFVLDDEGKLI